VRCTGSTARALLAALNDQASRSRFVEHMPTGIVLRYEDDKAGLNAELLVSLTSTKCSGD